MASDRAPLVKSTNFTYAQDPHAGFSILKAVTVWGYRKVPQDVSQSPTDSGSGCQGFDFGFASVSEILHKLLVLLELKLSRYPTQPFKYFVRFTPVTSGYSEFEPQKQRYQSAPPRR
jgi:hypothetical protein